VRSKQEQQEQADKEEQADKGLLEGKEAKEELQVLVAIALEEREERVDVGEMAAWEAQVQMVGAMVSIM